MRKIVVTPEVLDKYQAWVDDFAYRANLQFPIPVEFDGETPALAAADVCLDHGNTYGTDAPVPQECEDCKIIVSPALLLYPENDQRLVLAHEVAHYCIGYSKVWNWLDDMQDTWRWVLKISVGLMILSIASRIFMNGAAVHLFSTVAATAAITGILCSWRHSWESQHIELEADRIAIETFEAAPSDDWEAVLTDGETLFDRILARARFSAHPPSNVRVAKVYEYLGKRSR